LQQRAFGGAESKTAATALTTAKTAVYRHRHETISAK
jgi:hypothetical protein